MPVVEECHTSTSTPAIGLPVGSTTRQPAKSAGPGVGERSREPPLGVSGLRMRQKGPSRAAAVSVEPFAPLFIRQTRVETPMVSEKSTPSLWVSVVCLPMRFRKSTPYSHSFSVNFTSRTKACMCLTKASPISRMRASGAPDMACKTAGVTSFSSLMIMGRSSCLK